MIRANAQTLPSQGFGAAPHPAQNAATPGLARQFVPPHARNRSISGRFRLARRLLCGRRCHIPSPSPRPSRAPPQRRPRPPRAPLRRPPVSRARSRLHCTRLQPRQRPAAVRPNPRCRQPPPRRKRPATLFRLPVPTRSQAPLPSQGRRRGPPTPSPEQTAPMLMTNRLGRPRARCQRQQHRSKRHSRHPCRRHRWLAHPPQR